MHQRKIVLSRIREDCIVHEREWEGGWRWKEEGGKRGARGARPPPSQSARFVTSGTSHLFTFMCPPQAASCQSLPFFLLCLLSGNLLHSVLTITSLTGILNTELGIYQPPSGPIYQLPGWPSYHQLLYPLSHSHYQTNLPKTYFVHHIGQSLGGSPQTFN